MKFRLLGMLLLGCLAQSSSAAAANEIVFVATNPLKTARVAETIEINWDELIARLPGLQPDHLVLVDMNTGKNIVTQVIDLDQDGQPEQLLFQTDFGTDDPQKTYRLQKCSFPVSRLGSKVYGRFVPERKDDFAWENDRVAFRIYGPALEAEMVSSGIDVWAKRVPYSIIEKWYAAGDASYHTDSGEGLDFYTVGTTRGCGGSGIWDGHALQVSRNFTKFRRIANGPIRVLCELTYAPWQVEGAAIAEVKRISLDAGHNLNRIESLFQASQTQSIQFAAGIAIHQDWTSTVGSDERQGWLSQWESQADKGGLGCAIILDPTSLIEFKDQDGNHLAIGKAMTNQVVRYYAGAGWDKSGQFSDRKKWESYVDRTARALQAPIQITFLNFNSDYRKKNPPTESWARTIARTIMKTYPDPTDMDVYGKGWTYTNGFFLHGLYRLAQKEKNPEYSAYIKQWLDHYIDESGRLIPEEYKMEEFKLDDIETGKIALLMYQKTGDPRYLRACEQLIEQLQKQPRTTDGGYWHKRIYPWQMWLDGIYMADAFLLQYAAVTNKPQWTAEAIKQIELIAAHTLDKQTGLYYHGWDERKNPVWADPVSGASPAFWGRAIGWFAMALVDGLDELPADHPDRHKLLSILKDLSTALIRYQDPYTGLWYQVIDRGTKADNWHETSSSAMFCYAFARAVHQGYLPKKFLQSAEKSFKGLCDHHVYFDEQGLLYLTGTVKVGTLNFASSKGDYDYYISTDRRINDFKGVGAFLFAALELNK